MNYMVLDIETDGHTYRKRTCDPLDKRNKVVMVQVLYALQTGIIIRKDIFTIDFDGVDILVGQNIKFDLLYLWKEEKIQNFLKRGGIIWDTMIVDYLLEKQNTDLSYSMDAIAERYGNIPKKNTEVKRRYDEGKTTSEIIDEIGKQAFIDYAIQDVSVTNKIFLKQWDVIKTDNKFKQLIKTWMKAYVMIIEMEFNGLYIDKPLLELKYKEQTGVVNDLKKKVENNLQPHWPIPIDLNIRSPKQLSLILFGGELKYSVREEKLKDDEVVVYKSGKKIGEIVYRLKQKTHTFVGLYSRLTTVPTEKPGIYATNDAVLKEMSGDIPTLVLKYRKANKLLTTYYWDGKDKGFVPAINPYTGCIHSSFSMIGTATGRLASGKPNVQNLHPKMLGIFRSRFDGGSIVELDWSQLEVCVAAWLSNDSMLLIELGNNLDLHLTNARRLFKRDDIKPKERKLAKFMTFGILYGQGAKGLAAIHKIDVDLAKQFIEQFYEKYEGIRLWHIKLKEECSINKNGMSSHLVSRTGQRFYLKMYQAPQWMQDRGITMAFSPTEQKNYKVQGAASWVMNTALASIVTDCVFNRDKYRFINCVHDSALFDVASGYEQEVISVLKPKMERAVAEATGLDIFKLDVKSGKNWEECKK